MLLLVLCKREECHIVVVPVRIKPPATWGHSTIQTQISDKLKKSLKGCYPKEKAGEGMLLF